MTTMMMTKSAKSDLSVCWANLFGPRFSFRFSVGGCLKDRHFLMDGMVYTYQGPCLVASITI